MIFQSWKTNREKMAKIAHFVLKICTNRFRDYICSWLCANYLMVMLKA